jgi:hypothetical protein
MGKYKAARGAKKKKDSGIKGAIPCLVLIVGAMALMYFLFVSVLKQYP